MLDGIPWCYDCSLQKTFLEYNGCYNRLSKFFKIIDECSLRDKHVTARHALHAVLRTLELFVCVWNAVCIRWPDNAFIWDILNTEINLSLHRTSDSEQDQASVVQESKAGFLNRHDPQSDRGVLHFVFIICLH